jgi:Amidohydrolase family
MGCGGSIVVSFPVPRNLRAAGILSALFCLCLVRGLFAQGKGDASPLVFLHVTVINPGNSSVLSDRAVQVEGDRITRVAAADKFRIPRHARVIQAGGEFLIPGLWDMHVHSAFGDWFPRGRDVILPLFIANGVTGVRDMGGDIPVLLAWREQIAKRELAGPRMVIAGPMLDGYLPDGKSLRFPSTMPVMTPAQATAAVDSLKARGADFIKVQSLIPGDAYFAAAAEAHKQGLPFVGHVPDKIRLSETVSAGQKSVEHLMGIFEACSTQEDKFLHGQGNTRMLLSTQDPERCKRMIDLLAAHHTWQVPTFAWTRQGTFLDQLDWQHQPLDKYVPAYWREVTWRRFNDEMMPGVTADPPALRREYIAASLRMMGEMHRGGVRFLAGTDTAPGIYVMPGFSLHDELANFVEAGFTPMEALQTATSNPAEFLGWRDAGAVAEGDRADLVLMTANPLEDIRNTEKISAVVANGRFFDRAALDQLLAGAEAAAKDAKASER